MKEEERKAFKSALAFVALFVVRHPHQQLFPFVYGNLFPFLLHHPNVIISFTKNTLRAQKKAGSMGKREKEARWNGYVVLGARECPVLENVDLIGLAGSYQMRV